MTNNDKRVSKVKNDFTDLPDVKLYHYSKSFYDQLKTLNAQSQKVKTDEVKNHFEIYGDHISFLFERAPLDIIGKIYKGTSNTLWVPGSIIYEYQVSAKLIDFNKYDIVESPTQTDLFYNPKYDNLSDFDWHALMDNEKKNLRESGHNKRTFLLIAKRYTGLTRNYYALLPTRPNWDNLKLKYAPTVPHVMLYPKSGIIEYESYRNVLIPNIR
jgi:hypothetical protein